LIGDDLVGGIFEWRAHLMPSLNSFEAVAFHPPREALRVGGLGLLQAGLPHFLKVGTLVLLYLGDGRLRGRIAGCTAISSSAAPGVELLAHGGDMLGSLCNIVQALWVGTANY